MSIAEMHILNMVMLRMSHLYVRCNITYSRPAMTYPDTLQKWMSIYLINNYP